MTKILNTISEYEQFVVYGAQVVAYGAYTAIRHLCNKVPECFVVSSFLNNPVEIDGIPVRMLDTVSKDALIIVGVTELLQQEINATLQKKGYQHIINLTQHEEHLLMSAYFESIGKFPLLLRGKSGESEELALYEVKSYCDKPLMYPPNLQSFEYSIQAGAALTEDHIASILDHTGYSISHKNKQYCEMSATYWVWKNTDHQWKGIEHYRRHLCVKPEMLSEAVDVVLPLPYICYPNTMSQFGRFVTPAVSELLLKALKDLHPQEFETYNKILYGQYQYTYNLVCARKEVFHAYCEWFFEITEYMEIFAEQVPEIANTRALSYVAEVLTNLYFMYYQDRLKIFHVEKEIYI